MFCSNICVCVRIRGHRINSIKLRWFWNSVKPRTFCLDHLDPLLIRLGARLLTILPRRWPAEHPSLPCSRSQVWPRMTTATQSMSSESSACSQVFNLAQWHNDPRFHHHPRTIPQDPQGFSATSALCNKSENAANTWDTIWYNGCSWLKRIMANYGQLWSIMLC